LPSLVERLRQLPDDIAGLPLAFLYSCDFFPQYTKSRMKRPRTGSSINCSQGKAEGAMHKKTEQCESKN